MDNFINDVIADIGNMLDPACQLPAFAPHLLDFQIVPLLGEIALAGNVGHILPLRRGFLSQNGRRRIDILFKHFLYRGSGPPCDDIHSLPHCCS